MMSEANIVIAGDKVYAGIDEYDRSECTNAIVIEFTSQEEMGEAIRKGSVEFTVFETPQ